MLHSNDSTNAWGFSKIKVLLIILILGAIGTSIYFITNKEDATPVATTVISNKVNSNEYIAVKAWGVGIGIGTYSDKVTVSEPTSQNKTAPFYDVVKVTVKKDFDAYQDCESSMSIARIKDISGFDKIPTIKIDDYYYYNSGVSECAGSTPSINKALIGPNDLIKEFISLGVTKL